MLSLWVLWRTRWICLNFWHIAESYIFTVWSVVLVMVKSFLPMQENILRDRNDGSHCFHGIKWLLLRYTWLKWLGQELIKLSRLKQPGTKMFSMVEVTRVKEPGQMLKMWRSQQYTCICMSFTSTELQFSFYPIWPYCHPWSSVNTFCCGKSPITTNISSMTVSLVI